MVVISFPWAVTTNVKHDSTRLPSTWTVQAPQAPRSQPFFVPVKSKRSRRASSNVTRGSTFNLLGLPLTVKVISVRPASTPFAAESIRPSVCSLPFADPSIGLATVNPADMAASRLRNCLREGDASLLSVGEPGLTLSFKSSAITLSKFRRILDRSKMRFAVRVVQLRLSDALRRHENHHHGNRLRERHERLQQNGAHQNCAHRNGATRHSD